MIDIIEFENSYSRCKPNDTIMVRCANPKCKSPLKQKKLFNRMALPISIVQESILNNGIFVCPGCEPLIEKSNRQVNGKIILEFKDAIVK